MTILFAGGEMGAFIPSDSSVYETTAGLDYDAAFARCAITVKGSAYLQTSSWAAQQELWAHFEVTRGSGSGANAARIIELCDAAEVGQFKIETDTLQSTLQMYYWNGAAYVAIGSAVGVDTNNTKQTIDVHVVGNSGAGTCTLYVAGTERATGTADLSNCDDMTFARHYGRIGGVSEMCYSQCIVSTTSTIGRRLMTDVVTGAGATSQFTGAYTSIDEMTYSDGDFIFSDTPAQVSVFAGTPVGSLSGYTIEAIAVTARANTEGAGPTKIRMAVRTAATNYFGASDLSLSAGYSAYCTIWETNPNTTLVWTATDAAAIQFGVKSIA